MYYSSLINKFRDEQYLINMISADDVLRFGFSIGLNENTRILDLCCGYGTMLKIWNEAFGVRGVGVDREPEFINKGVSRLANGDIKLICGDVLQYSDSNKYDVVVCTELSSGLFDGFKEGVNFLAKFIKPEGAIVFGKLFSEIPNPPRELIEFDGPLPTLSGIYNEVKLCGYLIVKMASGDNSSWERYIMSGNSTLNVTEYSSKPERAAWTDKWRRMYYDYRRPYENWALFGIKKI